MLNSHFKLLLLNFVLSAILLVTFYFHGFLSGYGSNNSYLPKEIKLFSIYVLLHIVIIFFILFRKKKLNWHTWLASMVYIFLVYFLVALYAGYI